MKQDIDKADYARALTVCQRRRINLNIFVEHDEETLMARLADFTEEIENIDYIYLS